MSDERPIRQIETEDGPRQPLLSPEEKALRIENEKASRSHGPDVGEPIEDLPKPDPDDTSGSGAPAAPAPSKSALSRQH